MIRGEFSVIRTADPDDAPELVRLYDPDSPRAFFLDARREVQLLGLDELREVLGRKEILVTPFYAIENRQGEVRGFCSLKPSPPGTHYSELLCGFHEEDDYSRPIAREALEFLKQLAFVERKLNKIVAQCLENETSFREFLLREGFESDGVQRDVFYTKGRYYNLETLSTYRTTDNDAGQSLPDEAIRPGSK